jgi:hypothetical protein
MLATSAHQVQPRNICVHQDTTAVQVQTLLLHVLQAPTVQHGENHPLPVQIAQMDITAQLAQFSQLFVQQATSAEIH